MKKEIKMKEINYTKPELEEADYGKFVAGESPDMGDANIPEPR